MRMRLFLAALAATCALALGAAPAFADNEPGDVVLLEDDYAVVTMREADNGAHSHPVGILPSYQVFSDHLVLTWYCPGFTPTSNITPWYKGTTALSGTSSNSPLTVTETGTYRCTLSGTQNGEYVTCYLFFTVSNIGDGSIDQHGMFQSVSQGIGFSIDSAITYINAILNQPVLLFFCIALVLLTVGNPHYRLLFETFEVSVVCSTYTCFIK